MQNKILNSVSARSALTANGWRDDITLHIEDGIISIITNGITSDTEYDCMLSGMPKLPSHAF
ncbi:MAG: hypothetical protein MK052_12460, partial [Alphaproteobacteria bacterium]|nr:hypothetical protein [Alphaproteobacteria bacterium]